MHARAQARTHAPRTHTHARAHTHAHACTHMHARTHTHARTLTHTHTHTHAHMHARTHARTHTRTRYFPSLSLSLSLSPTLPPPPPPLPSTPIPNSHRITSDDVSSLRTNEKIHVQPVRGLEKLRADKSKEEVFGKVSNCERELQRWMVEAR